MISLLVVAAVVVLMVGVTMREVLHDGYRAIPTDPGWAGRDGPSNR